MLLPLPVLLFAANVGLARAISHDADHSGDCWQQWNDFWTANSSVSYSSTRLRAPAVTTTYVTAKTEYSTYITEYTTTSTHTKAQLLGPANDPNAQTRTLISDVVETFSGPVSTAISVGSSYTTTETISNTASYYSVATVHANASTPSCTLPPQYPPCQSQWDAWASADIRADNIQQPLCSQAKIEGSTCQDVISNYYSGIGVFGATGIPGWVTSGESTFWPTSQTFAPGCTLGCQRCAIMGDKVRILYWPASTATAVENGTGTATLAPQTGDENEMCTTVFEGNTLTSPTIYISYQALSASDSCSGIGRTFSNTIIPLSNSADLKSLAYKALDDHGAGPAMNGIQYLSWEYEERLFNFTDLEEPIPDAVYNQLPYCQMQYRGYTLNGMEDSMTFSCSREGPYNPIIAVPHEVRNLDPAWETCTGWYAGLYDPPRALQGAASAATPTAPVEVTSAAAEAGAIVTGDAPMHTNAPGSGHTRGTSSTRNANVAAASSTQSDEAPHSSQADGSREPAPTSSPLFDPFTNSKWTTAATSLIADEQVHTLHFKSSLPAIDGKTLSIGQTTVLGNRTVSIGPANVYINGNALLTPVSTTNTIWTLPPSTFPANGRTHTISFLSSSGAVLDDQRTLTPGTAALLGTHSLSLYPYGPYIYLDGSEIVATASTIVTPFPFTAKDATFGTSTSTGHSVPGRPSEVVLDGFTYTRGAEAQELGYLWWVSLRRDGVLTTVPLSYDSASEGLSSTSVEATTTSEDGEVPWPTSAVLWTPTTTGAESAEQTSRADKGRRPVWLFGMCLLGCVLGGLGG